MNSGDAQLHPKWCALATVSFPLKRFVRGLQLQSQDDIESKQSNCLLGETDGLEVQRFYEELTKKSKTNNPNTAITTACQRNNKKQRPLLKFDPKTFFRHATTNNIEQLVRFDYQGIDINICDAFGWTALMMAACEGSIDVVRKLLELGADKNIKERSGRTALDIAKQKGFEEISIMLQTDLECETRLRYRKRCSSVSTIQPFYCSTCEQTFSDATLLQHQTSTVHQFNMKSKNTENKLQKFNISHKNRGLQLMVKQGWDKESGLGPTQTGRLYPIKTVIRKKRTGLGIDQEPARVTHFGAYDSQAVKYNTSSVLPRNKKRSRNDIRTEKLREWKRERRLRKELS